MSIAFGSLNSAATPKNEFRTAALAELHPRDYRQVRPAR
jgi:hypothetical protein